MRLRSDVAAVVIGRNEGQRLVDCLSSLAGEVGQVVYVDSGSADDSIESARHVGASVVVLDPGKPFTAARARNAGLAQLAAEPRPPAYVQLIDGDCILQPGWIAAALAHMEANPRTAVVCGRRRERFPDASLWNRVIDREWNTPVGPALACGGDALVRAAALHAVGGFREGLIAGEEPELCLRLRQAGWQVWRIDAEMTLHDAAMMRFGQWWRRSRRAGHAFAEGASLHGAPPDRHWVAETRRALVWGAALPAATVVMPLVHPAFLVIWLIWPAQILRLALRPGWGLVHAALSVLGKVAEAQGVIGYHLGRIRGRRAGLVEYK
ncbi:MAG: glycosyltransferase [Gemmobacter sp.]